MQGQSPADLIPKYLMSMSRRILLIWEQGQNLGHLVRLREFSAQIRRRGGVPVWIVPSKFAAQSLIWSADERRVAPVVGKEGSKVARAQGLHRAPKCFADILLEIGFSDASALAHALGQWVRLFNELEPDAVVCDYSPVAQLAACCQALPTVHLTNGFDAPPGSFPAFFRAGASPPVAHSVTPSVEHLTSSIHEASKSIGRVHTLEEYLAWPTKVHDGLPETDPYGVRSGMRHIGPVTLDGAAFRSYWSEGRQMNGKRVFAYMRGETGNILTILESLKSAEASVLCVWPEVPKAHLERYRGTSIRIETEPVDLTTALERADAVVNYGSAGVVASTLLAGKAQLMVPIDLEKHQLALRMQAQELGLAWFPGQGPIRASIDSLLRDSRVGVAAQVVADTYTDGRLERERAELMDALVLEPCNLVPGSV